MAVFLRLCLNRLRMKWHRSQLSNLAACVTIILPTRVGSLSNLNRVQESAGMGATVAWVGPNYRVRLPTLPVAAFAQCGIKWVPCQQGVTHPRVAAGDVLQVWRKPLINCVSILGKPTRVGPRDRRLGVGLDLATMKIILLRNATKGLDGLIWTR